MTVKGKAGAAALTVAAPEAKLAEGAATKAATSTGKATAGAGTSSTAQRQRQQIDRIKAQRSPAPAGDQVTTPAPPPPGAGGPPSAFTDQTGSPSWWRAPNPQAAANGGSGFLLGVFLWALGLAYLEHGGAGVKQLLAAKFLNRTGG